MNAKADNKAATEPEWISIPELARRIGMSNEGCYRQARVNAIPGMVKMGRRFLVDYTEFLKSRRMAPKEGE
jgi:predicted DNA-binding transcriptional regulator AlpA